jgi:hypothetical protein
MSAPERVGLPTRFAESQAQTIVGLLWLTEKRFQHQNGETLKLFN